MSDARKFTNALLELVEQGYSDSEYVIRDLLHWMSEDDVKEFVEGMDSGVYLDTIVDKGILEADYE